MPQVNARLAFVLALLMLVLLSVAPATAAPMAEPRNQTEDLSDPEKVEAFFDGIVTGQLAAFPIAGTTISVVKDNELFFAKGYGYADVEEQIPVGADSTLFRPGSVSKLFVWTAMMQLVEAGSLDLDTDVNVYLDFEIPQKFGQPITLRNLMTHTPGFEDQGLGTFVPTEEQAAPLA